MAIVHTTQNAGGQRCTGHQRLRGAEGFAMDVVGRDTALAEIIRRLDLTRVVTVTGPGGIGKTTLADEVARREAHRFPLGTRRVDLTTIDDEQEVPAALAAQLGFGSFRALLDSPSDEPALVVVDNCEHVLDAAADAVAQLLDACRSPTVLATSRSPLGLAEESVVVLGPLALPDAEDDERHSPAVELFLRRALEAGAVAPDADIASVAKLCRLLDGVPLAIELAAARSRVLTPRELLDRLDDLDTLRRPRSRGPARHRGLRDTIAWSYALLDEDDRGFFDRLAVLSGPFTSDDAHAVTGEDTTASTIDRLDRLVADSLLTTTVGAGVTYHRQLEVVRSYARERLIDSGGWDATWQRFVDHVTERSVQLATDSRPGWDRSSLSTLLGRLDQHLSVLRWCLENDDEPARSFILVATLWGAVHQGRLGDIGPLAEQTLARWDDAGLPGRADAAATAATCRYLSGRPQDAIELAERALDDSAGAHFAPCTLRRVIGHSRVATGDLAGAVEILTEAIDRARERVPALAMEMEVSRAELVANLAEPSASADDPLGAALESVRAVTEEAARTGSAVNEIWARSVEATLVGRLDGRLARSLALRALSDARAALYPATESVNLHTLASICIDDGDLRDAAEHTRQLIDGLVARGAGSELRNGLRLAAVVLERSGDPAWCSLAATADSLPVVSLFSLPGHERHPLPPSDLPPMAVRDAVAIARGALDAVSQSTGAGHSSGAPSPDTSGSGHDTTVAIDRPAPNAWSCDGDVWTVTFDEITVNLRRSKGLADIVRLLDVPGTDIHCADLAGAVVRDRAGGEVIDAHARREYEQRVRELQSEIEDAEAGADLHRADRARMELDTIVDHLTAALGLGGRARRHTDSVERARSAVTQRIRSTIKRLGDEHPPLSAHLAASVRTGIYCSYRPERPTTWSISGSTTSTSSTWER